MKISIRSALALTGAALLLGACAVAPYDYNNGYGYNNGYNNGYDNGYAYGYGPAAPAYYDPPGYGYVAPSVELGFAFGDRDHGRWGGRREGREHEWREHEGR